MKFIFNLQRKYLFMMVGFVVASLAPSGWFLMCRLFNYEATHQGIYLYMFLSTAISLGAFGFIVGSYQDVLFRFLEQDNLTILLNQKAFFRKADHHYQLGVRYKDYLSVIMMDIDNFKDVNDDNNHMVGSAVLKKVGFIISEGLRETDVAARFGGDEFVICLPRTDLVMAGVVAERVRHVIEATTFTYKEFNIKVTASFGVAAMKCTANGSVEMIAERADHLLYKAKDAGRNQVVLDDDPAFFDVEKHGA
ncbi:GGDEF domain-containing protein [Pseudobacteriovorax antillogorgiicola]|uniref:diguanylate cyclase n=1 Tax=Pseudobacteriovorax antillogorgiicola TaxID=1513793 RepID=A0A1Y6BZ85_9BACT|nr:GGDEF domain-containing protein [Pseudobacteriovorax antillogorgiicola]TCS51218.1 diguanylate cyclase (GGDEF)-like protein [Pseudobacteriovorax antillogorgiicola]SMF37042.1 diguanylate cyclase (GGDEF) domain-containing protein [Pseudobacteriovorax antillogorgiicola]